MKRPHPVASLGWVQLDIEARFLALSLILSFSVHVVGPYQVVYLIGAGVPPLLIGFLRSVGFAANTLAEWPSGLLGDKYGLRLPAVLGFALSGFGTILIALFPDLPVLAAAFATLGVGNALLTDTLEAWVVNAMKRSGREERVKAVFGRVGGFARLAGILAGFAGSGLSLISTRLPLLAGGVSLVAASLLSALFVENGAGPLKRESVVGVILRNVDFLRRERAFRWYLAGDLVYTSLFQFFIIAWQLLLLKSRFPENLIGAFYSVMIACASAGGFLAVKLSGVHHVSMVLLSAILWPVAFIAMGTVNNAVIIVALILLLEVLWGLSRPFSVYWRNILIPSEIRAGVLSLISTLAALTTIATNVAYGLAVSSLGVSASFIAFGLLGLISPVCYAHARGAQGLRPRRSATAQARNLFPPDFPTRSSQQSFFHLTKLVSPCRFSGFHLVRTRFSFLSILTSALR